MVKKASVLQGLSAGRKLDRFRGNSSDPARSTLALVLAGGRGQRLLPLTITRCKPAMPFGGKYRIIDFTLSNCLNSGIRRIGVLTQFKAQTLIQHLRQGWNVFNPEFNEFLELLPAQQQVGDSWYRGTADAVFQNLALIDSLKPEHVLILAGDHVYKSDYRMMIEHHIASGAEVTVGCVDVPLDQTDSFGVLDIEGNGRIRQLTEKPAPGSLNVDDPTAVPVSMGIYVFSRKFLSRLLKQDARLTESGHDFGHDVIPQAIAEGVVMAYPFSKAQQEHYWQDVGTLDAYYEANMALLNGSACVNLYDEDWPIWSHQAQSPPTRFLRGARNERGSARDSLLAAGCTVRGANVSRSILFAGVSIDSGTRVSDSLLLPGVTIGKHCDIRNAIIEEGSIIPDGTRIGVDLEESRKRFHVTESGITVARMSGRYSAHSADDTAGNSMSERASLVIQR